MTGSPTVHAPVQKRPIAAVTAPADALAPTGGPHPRLRALVGAAAICMAAGLIAGCSANTTPSTSLPGSNSLGSGSSPGSISGSASSVPTCSSISAAEVGGALGFSVSEATMTGSSQNEQCIYNVTSQDTSLYPTVTLNLTASTMSLFTAGESAYTKGISTLSGVGDAAYSIASTYQEGGQNEVIAYAKGVMILVEGSASISQISSLITTIFSKL